MKRLRRNHSATFKAKVALAAIWGDRTLVEVAEQFKVHPDQLGQWRAELLERAAEVFATTADKHDAAPDLKALHGKIGQQALEIEWKGRSRVAAPGAATRSVAFVGVLPSTADVRGGLGADASHRRATFGASLCGQPHAGRSVA